MSTVGNGRPQDWPTEIRALARELSKKLDGATHGVRMGRSLARDVVTALHVGADALERECREIYGPEVDGG